jgi:hypothetical protein
VPSLPSLELPLKKCRRENIMTSDQIKEEIDKWVVKQRTRFEVDQNLKEKNRDYIKKEIENLEKMKAHSNMAIVWERLRKRNFGYPLSQTRSGNFFMDYNLQICLCLKRSPWDKLSTNQRTMKAEGIKQKLISLAKDLDDYGLASDGLALLTSSEISYLLQYGNKPNLDSYEVRESMIKHLFLKVSLSDLLNRFAGKFPMEIILKSSVNLQPNRKNADLIYFLRQLTKTNKKTFGNPFYEITSYVAEVFFPDSEMNEKKVSNLVR